MAVPQISLPERFHTNVDADVRPARRLPSSIGTLVVVAAALALFRFEALSVWVQIAVCWVLFMAMVRWIGYLIGSTARR